MIRVVENREEQARLVNSNRSSSTGPVLNDEAGLLEAAYWGSGSAPAPGYSKDLARNVIAEIRTDMDSFSDPESAVLQNHGYFLADIAVKRHTPGLLPAVPPPLGPPFPDWFPPNVSEAQIKEALKELEPQILRPKRRHVEPV